MASGRPPDAAIRAARKMRHDDIHDPRSRSAGEGEQALHLQRRPREVLHTFDSRVQREQVAVYRRDDGQYVVEFTTQGLRRGDLVGGSYAIVAPEDLRRVI